MVDEGVAVGRAALRHAPYLGDIVSVERLDGGYSWRTYRVDGTTESVIVRIAPAGGTVEPYDPETERLALLAANEAVPAPKVIAVEHDPSELGAAYGVHTLVPGQVLRTGMVTDTNERTRYRAAFTHHLAALHRHGDAGVIDYEATTVTAAIERELDRLAGRFSRAAAGSPADTVMRWLIVNRPRSDEPPVVCHGDYRFGNIAWTAPGEIGGILDWERAWVGDPMADIAFTRLWSGWCAIDDDDLDDYTSRSGRRVDHERLAYAHRLELARSYASSLLGRKALLDGRADDHRLLDIGDAGEQGLARLADQLHDPDIATDTERNHAPHRS